jgi:hypothetical protein
MASWHDARMPVALVVMAWIPAALWLDRTAGPAGQAALGLATWGLLVALLARETPLVRAQTVVVVLFATVVEYVFSGALEVYVYRLGHVPPYVPPGHGLVYLAALGFTRWAWLRSREAVAVRVAAALACAYAAYGLVLAPRPDALGAFWCLCLLGFLRWGRDRLLYVGALVAVTYLEILGTWWGVWTWLPVDTIAGWVSIGNPPSVAAGGYGWFDLAAVGAAPVLLAVLARARAWSPAGSQRPPSRATTSSWSTPLVVSAQPAVNAGEPS